MARAIYEAHVSDKVHLLLASRAFGLPLLPTAKELVAGGFGTAFAAENLGVRISKFDGHVAYLLFGVRACLDTRNLSHEGRFSMLNLRITINFD